MAKKKKVSIVAETPQELAKLMNLDPSIVIEWEFRHSVSLQIAKNIESKGLVMAEVARRAGTSRARVSRIASGDTVAISLEVLLRVLGATGQKVELRFLKAS